MAIISLRVTDFRNISTVDLTPGQHGLNVICGNNGSGKTSLLEAIHYLGLGRSFRSSSAGKLIRHDTKKFSLFAQLLSEGQRHIPVGVERELNGSARMRMSEKDVHTITELASFLPIRVINSYSHNIFESGPIFRRKYLDWGLFYQYEGFFPCWKNYERVLKQRNCSLREKRPKREIEIWTDELIKHGTELDQYRRDYVQALTPIFSSLVQDLLSISAMKINYLKGWGQHIDFTVALANTYDEDLRFGYTQTGPQRADLDIVMNGISVKHFLSRGQQKLLICAMIIGQGMLLAKYTNKRVIYLVDDLPAELDIASRKKLLTLLSKQETQIFITAIESDMISAVIDDPEVPMKVFHVEHGRLVSGSR